MKKRDSDKNPFEKKNLVKLAPAAVVIAAVAAAGAQAGSSGKEVTAETREVVKSQDLESLLKTAYSYEAADDEAKEESLLKAGKNTSSSSKKKTSKISKKKSGIKKGSSKTLPVKTAASSGVGQGSTTTPTTEVPEGGYKDGTYQGSGTGFGGTITVQVTVSGGKITAVDILSASGETGSYFASAQGVVSKVLSSQSPNVDAVSGATYSSNGIIQAVQNALSQAGNSDSATPAATPTPTPTPKPAKKPKKDTSVSYKDGVYEGQAEGFDGIVTVKVTIKNGKIKKTRPLAENYLLVDGLHEPIISEELWNLAQAKMKQHYRPTGVNGITQNPLAGLVHCSYCGNAMQRRPYLKTGQPASLICTTHFCPQISSPLYMVEGKILEALSLWMKQHEPTWEEESSADVFSLEHAIADMEQELQGLQSQFEKIFEFLETGIYTPEVFTARNKTLSEKMAEIRSAIEETQAELSKLKAARKNQVSMIPKIKNILDTYETLTPAEKNKLLKEVLDHVEYHKKIKGKKNVPADNFEIILFPKISPEN